MYYLLSYSNYYIIIAFNVLKGWKTISIKFSWLPIKSYNQTANIKLGNILIFHILLTYINNIIWYNLQKKDI